MLAYLASRPSPAKRQSSPNAFLLIISAHVALLAAVMSAKMDLPRRIFRDSPTVVFFPKPPPPAGPTVEQRPQTQSKDTIDHSRPHDALPLAGGQSADTGGDAIVGPGPVGGGTVLIPEPPRPIPAPIRQDARLLTPASQLKPPYPPSKLASEEEAALRLRLAIDERGRVVAVDPLGAADPIFLDAARRYLIAHWRYEPATEDGRAIGSSVTITLRFQLDG